LNDAIQEALLELERAHEVRVLLAVESGSRAWGFASPDSDFDVRFVYVHPRDWYMTIAERRDVIESMLPRDLDLSGWELRKTLRLFSRCNLALNEWLGSPVQYRIEPRFLAQMQSLLPDYFNPIAALFHYRKMAAHALREGLTGNRISIKKLFYVWRPLLACRWVRHSATQPPTEFSRLMEAAWVTPAEKEELGELLVRKAGAQEREAVSLDSGRLARIERELVEHEATGASLNAPARPGTEKLDRVFREWAV
jgi:predicted nucleotidyltransferase